MTDAAETRSRPPAFVVYLLGLVGGMAGIGAAVYQEMLHGFWLAVVLVGPAIEEACKPIGVILMLEKRAHWLRSRKHVVIMAVLGALVFATVENLVYVHVYHPRGGTGFVIYRYTVCTAMHVAASGIFGVGLAKMWRQIHLEGGTFDIDRIFRYYVAAVAVHAVYNTAAVVLSLSGVLRF